VKPPVPKFEHLLSMVGPYGVFAHAEFDTPRVEDGYCVADMAGVLLAASRERQPDPQVVELARIALDFLEAAQTSNGMFFHRRDASGAFPGTASNEDCWGRAIWALGSAVARLDDAALVAKAQLLYERGVEVRSPWPRSMAFACLGAGEVLSVKRANVGSRELMVEALVTLDRSTMSDEWEWPEERLSYANAVLPEALLVLGSTLANPRVFQDGLTQLGWLLALETKSGHLSVMSSRGRRFESVHEQFDQPPIEVAALCDACLRAFNLTGDVRWSRGVDDCVQWFLGRNDAGVMMFDVLTGGGYDGLTEHGLNLNQGAESTLAMISTLQSVTQLQLTA